MLSVGVEEEFLLLEPDGRVAPVADRVLAAAGLDGDQLKNELMSFQVETATRVCLGLDELRAELVRLRLRAAHGAAAAGARLVATAMPPYESGPLDQVTPDPRYLGLARRYPWAAVVGSACACQIHVGVPDPDLRAEVLVRMRPWLAALLALGGNSPIGRGADTGWSSRRYRALLRWPTFRPPGTLTGPAPYAAYEQRVREAIARGDAADPGNVYFLARLSHRYPTIEVRLCDTSLTPADTVLLAAVVRGLVTALVEDARQGRPIAPVSATRLGADLLSVARNATLRPLPRSRGSAAASSKLIADLQARIAPAVSGTRDGEEIARGLARLRRTGTGADRQRALLARAPTRRAFVTALAQTTAPLPRTRLTRHST